METSKRGIVIADTAFGFNNTGKAGRVMVSTPFIKPLDLRRYLIYWDEIEWVTINEANVSLNREVDLLCEERIFTMTMLPFYRLIGDEDNMWDRIVYAQWTVFRENNHRPNEIWSLGNFSTDPTIARYKGPKQPGVEIALINALPIATADTPIEEILKFKQRRKDELIRFRVALGNFYEEINKTADIQRSTLQRADEIAIAVNDLHRVMGESFIKKLVSSFKVDLNVIDVLTGVGTAIGLSRIHNLPPELIPFISGVIPALKITIGNIAKPKGIPENLRDYSYLYYIETELNKKSRRSRR